MRRRAPPSGRTGPGHISGNQGFEREDRSSGEAGLAARGSPAEQGLSGFKHSWGPRARLQRSHASVRTPLRVPRVACGHARRQAGCGRQVLRAPAIAPLEATDQLSPPIRPDAAPDPGVRASRARSPRAAALIPGCAHPRSCPAPLTPRSGNRPRAPILMGSPNREAVRDAAEHGMRWGSVQIGLHWTIAALVLLVQVPAGHHHGLGPARHGPERRLQHPQDQRDRDLPARDHPARLALLASGAGYAPDMPPWQARLARTTHALLYLVLFPMPVTGFLYTALCGFPVPFFMLYDLARLVPENKPVAELFGYAHLSCSGCSTSRSLCTSRARSSTTSYARTACSAGCCRRPRRCRRCGASAPAHSLDLRHCRPPV